MLRFIIILLGLLAVATAFYFYGYERGYSRTIGDVYAAMLETAIRRGLVTTPDEVEAFTRQFAKKFL